jgi:hypothetical protein
MTKTKKAAKPKSKTYVVDPDGKVYQVADPFPAAFENLVEMTSEDRRMLAQEIYAGIGVEFDDDGFPLCPKCGMIGDCEDPNADEHSQWACQQTECDGYMQIFYTGAMEAEG